MPYGVTDPASIVRTLSNQYRTRQGLGNLSNTGGATPNPPGGGTPPPHSVGLPVEPNLGEPPGPILPGGGAPGAPTNLGWGAGIPSVDTAEFAGSPVGEQVLNTLASQRNRVLGRSSSIGQGRGGNNQNYTGISPSAAGNISSGQVQLQNGLPYERMEGGGYGLATSRFDEYLQPAQGGRGYFTPARGQPSLAAPLQQASYGGGAPSTPGGAVWNPATASYERAAPPVIPGALPGAGDQYNYPGGSPTPPTQYPQDAKGAMAAIQAGDLATANAILQSIIGSSPGVPVYGPSAGQAGSKKIADMAPYELSDLATALASVGQQAVAAEIAKLLQGLYSPIANTFLSDYSKFFGA
jgi:hypothetical protein